MSSDRSKTVYYASIGPELTLYDIDIDGAALIKRGAVTLPANIQYVWPHPSRRTLYAVSSNGGPQVTGDTHRANALTIDPATGALQLHGPAAALPSRPIHCSVDVSGRYLLTTYNNPSNVTVHRLNADGTIGAPVAQPEKLDAGIYAHQILATPSNDTVLLVTRGNDAKADKPEDPGAIKTFGFANGALNGLASIAPGTGLGFGPRHLDFHPTQPWVFVSIERQNKLYVYKLDASSGLARTPMFVKDTLADPKPKVRQAAGAIHVHPSGKFVYLTNRASDLVDLNGAKAFTGGENNIAVFAIDQTSGEPTLIQNADGRAVEFRTFGIEPRGRMLVAASIKPAPVRDASGTKIVPAKLSVFHIGSDGKLELKRQYDVDTGVHQQFWSGMVTL
ncbi:MAG TPA: beta-propeller fold lactonase family protein [Xanthobacteraceae bacterium]|nr:beta-propeller fold lactonase family protein [Xanthobacteraceae bacterium]